jgi:GT2 family glycosyltransferase
MNEEISAKKLCDIIVPTFNRIDHTQQFVKSHLSNTQTPSRVIFVDNGSGDGTREYLSTLTDTNIHTFTVILNNANKGYGPAMNQGLAIADAPYVCFANNDIIFTKGWLEEIILTFKEYPDVGLLNPNSNNLNIRPKEGESIDSFADLLKKTYTKGSFVDLPFCIGFCMVVKRIVLDNIGGFDEAFAPMYFEDSDYSRRVHKAGYRLGIARRSYVWHHEGGSSSQLGKDREAIFKRSEQTYLRKWGRTLRIGWLAESEEELSKQLESAVAIARDANFISFWVKGLKSERKEIFRAANVHEFADVKFYPMDGHFALFWKALTKKKKFDLIITPDKKLRAMLRLFGQNGVASPDTAFIRELKFKGIPKA